MLAHTNIKRSRKYVFEIKNLYLRTYLGQIVINTSTIRSNALHNSMVIKIIVTCSMSTGGSLIRYSNGHTK